MTSTAPNQYLLKRYEFTLMQSFPKHMDRDPRATSTIEYVDEYTIHAAREKLPDLDPEDGCFWQISHVGFPET